MDSNHSKAGSVGPAEKLLLEPWQSVFRMAYGFSLLLVIARWRGAHVPWWELLVLFLGALILLRVAPMFPRKVLPFSESLKAAWFSQRQMAKQYDSYQWAKLLWIGTGMAVYTACTGRLQAQEGVLALTCIAAGVLGTVFCRQAQAAVRRMAEAANA